MWGPNSPVFFQRMTLPRTPRPHSHSAERRHASSLVGFLGCRAVKEMAENICVGRPLFCYLPYSESFSFLDLIHSDRNTKVTKLQSRRTSIPEIIASLVLFLTTRISKPRLIHSIRRAQGSPELTLQGPPIKRVFQLRVSYHKDNRCVF